MPEVSYKKLDAKRTRTELTLINNKKKRELFGEVDLEDLELFENQIAEIKLTDCNNEDDFDVKKFVAGDYKDIKNLIIADGEDFVIVIEDVKFKEFLVDVGLNYDKLELILLEGKVQIVKEDNDFRYYRKYSL